MPNEGPLYNLPPTQPGITEDQVRQIVYGILGNYNIPTKVSGSFLQSANFITGIQGWQLRPDGAEVNGSFSVTQLNIPNSTTANSFHVDSNGNTWWGANVADFGIDPNNAPAYILNDGTATFANIVVTGGSIPASVITGSPPAASVDISAQDWTFSGTWSSTDADTVAWTLGTLVFSDGTSYSIVAGNTGNMGAKTYIYLNNAVSSTVLQTTTTPGTAVGNGKVLIAVAEADTGSASFSVMNDKALEINASTITAGSIVGNQIAAGTITAGNISVANLAAISADLGTITAGDITLDSSGFIRGGQTAYNTGTGFFLGFDVADYKFSLGDPSGDRLTWDGNTLLFTGTTSTLGLFGDGSDSDVTISVNTTLTSDMYYANLTINAAIVLNTGGYAIYVLGVLTNNGTIRNNGGNGGNGQLGSASGTGDTGLGGSAGAAAPGVSFAPGKVGKAGGSGTSLGGGAGANGFSSNPSLGSSGVSGGDGGGTGGGSPGGLGGSGGSATTETVTAKSDIYGGTIPIPAGVVLTAQKNLEFRGSVSSLTLSASAGSGGGGAGGGDTVQTGAGGGGSGGTGGIVVVIARTISGTGTIESNGGTGGNGGDGASPSIGLCGGGGGGGGGSGGIVLLAYESISGQTAQALGGTGGTRGIATGGGNNGFNGSNGAAGQIYQVKVV